MPSKKPSKKELQAQICSLQDVVAEAHNRIDALDTQAGEALKIVTGRVMDTGSGALYELTQSVIELRSGLGTISSRLNLLEAVVKGLCNAK